MAYNYNTREVDCASLSEEGTCHESDGHATWTVGRDLGIPNTITKYGTFEPRIQLRTSCLPLSSPTMVRQQ
jgi:hypothetical protein